jgi:murein L,D-transpeptidase YafK
MRWVGLAVGIVGLVMVGRDVLGSPPSAIAKPPTPKVLAIRRICAENGVHYPPKRIFLRAFKQERELELWGSDKRGKMHLLRSYPVAAASGGPGPKRHEGDLQVPEGVYRVDRFNPHSLFHLSLGLNYPNKADLILGDKSKPGADIFIHGNQVSTGCLAMTDAKIEEIYSLASSATQPIPVHIFPCRMTGPGYQALKRRYPEFVALWRQLEPIYRRFEATHVVPRVSISDKGRYVLQRPSR